MGHCSLDWSVSLSQTVEGQCSLGKSVTLCWIVLGDIVTWVTVRLSWSRLDTVAWVGVSHLGGLLGGTL